jgi:VWFA-related protein
MTRVLAVLVALWLSPLDAQSPRFSTGIDGVRVDVLVTNRRSPVFGLSRDDFELRDNGVLQRITDVSRETLPINLICVLDASGSVAGQPLRDLREAARLLYSSLGPADRGALLTFSHRVRLHATLTNDRDRLRRLVDDVRPSGTTAFLDAVFGGLALRESDPGRTLLLLFTDGNDNASWLQATDVLEAVRSSDVVIYPVKSIDRRFFSSGTIDIPGAGEAERLLHALADESGGRVIDAESGDRLSRTFLAVLEEFRQRYVLSYTPTGVASSGWHTIDVTLRGQQGQVKARRGYVGGGLTPARGDKTPRK